MAKAAAVTDKGEEERTTKTHTSIVVQIFKWSSFILLLLHVWCHCSFTSLLFLNVLPAFSAHMRSPVEIFTKIVCTSATSLYLIYTQIRSSVIGRKILELHCIMYILLLWSRVSACICLSTIHTFVWQASAMICFYFHKFIFSRLIFFTLPISYTFWATIFNNGPNQFTFGLFFSFSKCEYYSSFRERRRRWTSMRTQDLAH